MAEDDVNENEDLVIRGESQGDDDDDEDLPVRVLDDFVVYTSEASEAVSIAELLQLEYSSQTYLASGLVRPWIDPEDDSEDSEDSGDEGDTVDHRKASSSEDRDRVSLSKILELNLHPSSDGDYPIDPCVYTTCGIFMLY